MFSSCWTWFHVPSFITQTRQANGAFQVLAVCRQAFYQHALQLIRHIDIDNPQATVPRTAFWLFFGDYWFCLSSPPPKVAIGILLIHLFNPRTWLRISIMALCLMLSVVGIVGFFICLFYCSPPQFQWDPYRYPNGTGWSESVITGYTFAFAGQFFLYSSAHVGDSRLTMFCSTRCPYRSCVCNLPWHYYLGAPNA